MATRHTGTGQRIENFIEDSRRLALEDFEQQHGSGFLLLTAAGFKQDEGVTSTELVLLDQEEAPGAGERTEGVSVLVFAVRGQAAAETHLITVGRTSNNDVVVPDISVSRFHAFFKRSASGVFQVLDCGSTNGTTVNGFSVPTKGSGSAADLKTGDNVRLGQMDLTFLDAKALRAFAIKFAK